LGPRDELECFFQICEEMDWSSPLEEDLTKFDYKWEKENRFFLEPHYTPLEAMI